MPAEVVTPAAAIEQLRALPGEFAYIDAERTGYLFHGDERVFLRVGAADSLIVPALIDCFGRSEPATATLDGTPVPLGIMCWQAFLRTKYYQPRQRVTSLPLRYQNRPITRLTSSPEQLAQIRQWWRSYWEAGSPLLQVRPPT
jgi:hypothetical protein